MLLDRQDDAHDDLKKSVAMTDNRMTKTRQVPSSRVLDSDNYASVQVCGPLAVNVPREWSMTRKANWLNVAL